MAGKITENIVLFLRSDPSVQIFADKVQLDGSALPVPCPKGLKKKTILVDNPTWSADRTLYKLEDTFRPDIKTLEGVQKFLAGHNNLPCQPRSGYDSFTNAEGPTNPKSPRKFSPDGTLRNVLVFLQALHLKVAEGGQKGEDAAALLAMIPQYNAVAAADANRVLESLKAETLRTKAKDLDVDPDELAEFIKQRAAARAAAGGKVPAASVTADDEGDIDEDDDDSLEVDADAEAEEVQV